MCKIFQFLLSVVLCLAVNLTALDVYSTQSLKSNFELVEQENVAKDDTNFQTKELFYNSQKWLVFINSIFPISVTFQYIQTIFPSHYSSPLIKPPNLLI